MIDLNSLGNSVVFNNGVAGKVDNLKLRVEKKDLADTSNQPDFKVFVTQQNGAEINQGFYYPDDNIDQDRFNQLVSRVASIAKALVPEDFQFESVEDKSPRQIVDYIFDVINKYADNTLVNVFTTYGTVNNPKKYLQFRYFNFIEKAGTEPTTLFARNNDQMVRVEASTTSDNSAFGTSVAPASSGVPGWS